MAQTLTDTKELILLRKLAKISRKTYEAYDAMFKEKTWESEEVWRELEDQTRQVLHELSLANKPPAPQLDFSDMMETLKQC